MPRARPIRRARVAFQLATYGLLGAHILGWYLLGLEQIGTFSPNGLFYLAQTGLVNAGVVVTVAALLATVVLGNGFCGWACHFGALQDFVHAVLSRLGVRPLRVQLSFRLRAVLLFKMLVVNALVTWAALGLPSLAVELGAPEPCYAIGTTLTVVLDVAVLAVLTTWVFGHRAFCRLLCPVILLTRAGNAVAPLRMRLSDRCVGCGACDRACPMQNPVSASLAKGGVAALDCVRCGRCRDACPVGAISYGLRRPTPPARPAPARRSPKDSATRTPARNWTRRAWTLPLRQRCRTPTPRASLACSRWRTRPGARSAGTSPQPPLWAGPAWTPWSPPASAWWRAFARTRPRTRTARTWCTAWPRPWT